MRMPHSDGYFTKIADDTRQFFRNPGLVAVTTVAAVLIFVFIVFPIGSVLQKSFTVSYPTVYIRYHHNIATPGDLEKKLIQPVMAVLSPVPGLVKSSVVREDPQTVLIFLRFEKSWNDLKGLNDAKRAIRPIQATIEPHIEKVKYKLSKERIYSTETYKDFFANSVHVQGAIMITPN